MKKPKHICLLFLCICILSSCKSTSSATLIKPVVATESASTIEDGALLDMFRDELYPNGMFIWSFVNGEHIEVDSSQRLDAYHILVTNIADMDALKENYMAVFSTTMWEKTIVPMFFSVEVPLFIEAEGKLYFSTESGAGAGYAPDFDTAKVTEKQADAFAIQVQMVTPDGAGPIYTFKIVQQNGNWVLDTFFLWMPE